MDRISQAYRGVAMSNLAVQTVIVAAISVSLGIIILGLARRALLTFRYAMGWFGLFGLGALSGLFLRVSEPLSTAIGVTPGVVVLTAGVIALVGICIQLSISISGVQIRARRLAEEIALSNTPPAGSMPTQETLVIVPALNEQATITGVVEGLIDIPLDVVVVDDGSTDDTARRARDAGAVVISMPYNAGVGGALRTGLLYAVRHGYQQVVQCDGDGQHPPQHVRELLNAAEQQQSHIMIGSRFAPGATTSMRVSIIRRLAMRVLAKGASRAAASAVSDATSGFRVFRGSVISALSRSMPDYYLGDTYETVVAAGRAGYRVREVPIPIIERAHGTSSASNFDAVQLTLRAFLTSTLRIHVRLPAPRD